MSSTTAVLVFTPIILFLIHLAYRFWIESSSGKIDNAHFLERKFGCPIWIYAASFIWIMCGAIVLVFNQTYVGYILAGCFLILFIYSLYRLRNYYVIIQNGKVIFRNGKSQEIFSLSSVKHVVVGIGTIDVDRNRKEKIHISVFIQKASLLVAMLRRYRP